eukprot:2596788-Pyramimonas_sp.AAC.1
MMRSASRRRLALTALFGEVRRPSEANASPVPATVATNMLSTPGSAPTPATDRSSILIRGARAPVGLDCVALANMT